ncbi:MAG TPA: response regulator [Burkholderiaceae bacterium]
MQAALHVSEPLGRLRRNAAASGDLGDDANAPGVSGTASGTGTRTPCVLLVEDNAINQVVALEFLALMGLSASLAKNGLEAIEQCSQCAPDLVLMDIQMPGMDGLECTRKLRAMQQRGELAPFPIIALTAHALASDIEASRAAGMDEHLTKPLDFGQLHAHLSRWLKTPKSN